LSAFSPGTGEAMADRSPYSRPGERRVYRDRNGGTGVHARRTTPVRRRDDEAGGAAAPDASKIKKARTKRPLWQRLIFAFVLVLAVGALSFLVGYLVGLKLALVAFTLA
jgi:hypothetical protein